MENCENLIRAYTNRRGLFSTALSNAPLLQVAAYEQWQQKWIDYLHTAGRDAMSRAGIAFTNGPLDRPLHDTQTLRVRQGPFMEAIRKRTSASGRNP